MTTATSQVGSTQLAVVPGSPPALPESAQTAQAIYNQFKTTHAAQPYSSADRLHFAYLSLKSSLNVTWITADERVQLDYYNSIQKVVKAYQEFHEAKESQQPFNKIVQKSRNVAKSYAELVQRIKTDTAAKNLKPNERRLVFKATRMAINAELDPSLRELDKSGKFTEGKRGFFTEIHGCFALASVHDGDQLSETALTDFLRGIDDEVARADVNADEVKARVKDGYLMALASIPNVRPHLFYVRHALEVQMTKLDDKTLEGVQRAFTNDIQIGSETYLGLDSLLNNDTEITVQDLARIDYEKEGLTLSLFSYLELTEQKVDDFLESVNEIRSQFSDIKGFIDEVAKDQIALTAAGVVVKAEEAKFEQQKAEKAAEKTNFETSLPLAQKQVKEKSEQEAELRKSYAESLQAAIAENVVGKGSSEALRAKVLENSRAVDSCVAELKKHEATLTKITERLAAIEIELAQGEPEGLKKAKEEQARIEALIKEGSEDLDEEIKLLPVFVTINMDEQKITITPGALFPEDKVKAAITKSCNNALKESVHIVDRMDGSARDALDKCIERNTIAIKADRYVPITIAPKEFSALHGFVLADEWLNTALASKLEKRVELDDSESAIQAMLNRTSKPRNILKEFIDRHQLDSSVQMTKTEFENLQLFWNEKYKTIHQSPARLQLNGKISEPVTGRELPEQETLNEFILRLQRYSAFERGGAIEISDEENGALSAYVEDIEKLRTKLNAGQFVSKADAAVTAEDIDKFKQKFKTQSRHAAAVASFTQRRDQNETARMTPDELRAFDAFLLEAKKIKEFEAKVENKLLADNNEAFSGTENEVLENNAYDVISGDLFIND